MCDCIKCQYIKTKVSSLKIMTIFLMALFISVFATGIGGQSTFYNIQPNCSINTTEILNCSSQNIKLECYEPHPEFVNYMNFIFNGTLYPSSFISTNNYSSIISLSPISAMLNRIYLWNNVIIYDTQDNIAIYPLNLNITHSCSECFQNITQINSTCQNNDLKYITYNDTEECLKPIPLDFNESCDYCMPNFQCTAYNPAICGIQTTIRECLSVSDLNNCYAQTGLSTDNFTGLLDDFDTPCNFNDWKLNQTLLSTLTTNLYINSYPYVELNQTVNMELTVKMGNTKILIQNVQMQLFNQTYVFTKNNPTTSFMFSFQIHEIGDYPFTITGRENNSQVFTINGIFYVREFADVRIELFEKKLLRPRYENDLAYVIGIKDETTSITKSFEESADSFNKIGTFIDKISRINRTAYYSYRGGKQVFYAPYIDGIATLRLPIEDTSWIVRFLNAESSNDYIFEEYNYAKIRTLDGAGTQDIFLTNGVVTKDLNIKFLVSPYDVRFFSNAVKWLIFFVVVLIFIGLCVLLYYQTQDAGLVSKLAIFFSIVTAVGFILLRWWLG